MTVLALPGIAEDDALERAVGVKRSLAALEADQYLYLLEYLEECAADPDVLRVSGAQRVHPYGGDGTPDIPEFAVCEVAAALGLTNRGASSLVADIVDIRYRLPLLFACLRDGDVDAFRVRMVAQTTRLLTPEQAAEVDARLSRRDADQQPLLGRLPRSKVYDIIEQYRCADDPGGAEDDAAHERSGRHVTFRRDRLGVEDLEATLGTADARRLAERIHEVAGWLAETGDDRGRDVRRSTALGLLADPAALANLWGRVRAHRASQVRAAANGRGDRPGNCNDDESRDDPAGPGSSGDRDTFAAGGAEAAASDGPDDDARRGSGPDVADALRRLPLPRAVLYIHFDRASGTWSLDGSGPLTRSEAIDILGHSHVTVKPVIDLEQNLSYTGYVAPPRLKEQTALLNAGRCTFPHCTRSAWRGEYDHQHDYAAGGPTDSRNGHRLCKHHHRCKTFTAWDVTSPAPGIWVWRSPRGRCYLVTAGTTTSLDLDVFRYAA